MTCDLQSGGSREILMTKGIAFPSIVEPTSNIYIHLLAENKSAVSPSSLLRFGEREKTSSPGVCVCGEGGE